jgi:mono/diheme cytochrome c family protein
MMNTRTCIAACAIFLLPIALIASMKAASQKTAEKPSTKAVASDTDIKRGKYLVEEVAKCSECHTPRDAQGQLDPDHWLQGAPIWITPVRATSSWADRAPALAGFPGYSDADAVNILEKGVGANGEIIRPPMHIYHLKHEDTIAIVAYLRSLPSTQPR